jgi:DNA-binding transcriptional LysR family regulator
MNPQTSDIETFIEVVEKGSFGRAAGSMLVSQPAISDRILRLENVVGLRIPVISDTETGVFGHPESEAA